MLLAIDIGNSSTALGLFEGERLIKTGRCQTVKDSSSGAIARELREFIDQNNFHPEQLSMMAVASVVPLLTPLYESASNELNIKPLIISTALKMPLKMGYQTPETLGVDRLANAVAAYSKYGGPIMVVDYGTAVKFDIATDNGVYLGGAIAPGPITAGAALSEKAAQLFEVDIIRPEKAIGRNTIECLRAGLYYGMVGMVDNIIKVIIDEWTVRPRIIATGGLAAKFAGESRFIEMTLPNLTLDGIRIIAENQPAI